MACPCPEQDNQGRHNSSGVKFHVFHLFEVLSHLLGTELPGTSVLHETSTGSTTTQHSLLHTWHGHATARTGPDRAAWPATVLLPLLPPRHWPQPSCQAGFCPGSIATAVQEPTGVSEAWQETGAAPAPGVTGRQLPGTGSPARTGAYTPCPRLQALGAWPGLGPGAPLRAPRAGTEPRRRRWGPGPPRR